MKRKITFGLIIAMSLALCSCGGADWTTTVEASFVVVNNSDRPQKYGVSIDFEGLEDGADITQGSYFSDTALPVGETSASFKVKASASYPFEYGGAPDVNAAKVFLATCEADESFGMIVFGPHTTWTCEFKNGGSYKIVLKRNDSYPYDTATISEN